MTLRVPDAWQFALLALAAYRLYRLGARDTITEPLRAAATYPDDAKVTLDEKPEDEGLIVVGAERGRNPKGWRVYAATLIRCPWCLGAYLSVAVYILWIWQPRWTMAISVPLALSAVLALAAKNLDK